MLRPATALLLILASGAAWAAPVNPEAPKTVETPKSVEAPKTVEAPKIVEAPKGAEASAPVVLANHKAVYDLSLVSTGGTRSIDSARGRIVVDFKGDACRGYTMETRQVTVLESGESGSRTSDLRNVTFESGDAKDLRFRTITVLNGNQSPPVDGTAVAEGDALKVKLKEPTRAAFTAAGPVLFPSQHMRRLVEAARAGETTVSTKLFDGSDDGRKVYDTLAVIGRKAPANAAADRDKPLHEGEMATVPRWPVTLSYFTQGEGERTPIYTLSFDLYENGVSGALKLDYGDFAIRGDMTRLELDKASEKPCTP